MRGHFDNLSPRVESVEKSLLSPPRHQGTKDWNHSAAETNTLFRIYTCIISALFVMNFAGCRTYFPARVAVVHESNSSLGAPTWVQLWSSNFQPTAVAFCPAYGGLIVGERSGQILRLDTATGHHLENWRAHGTWIGNIAISEDGEYLCSSTNLGTSSGDNFVRVWSLKTKEKRLEIPVTDGDVTSCGISADGTYVAFETGKGAGIVSSISMAGKEWLPKLPADRSTVHLYEASSKRELWTHTLPWELGTRMLYFRNLGPGIDEFLGQNQLVKLVVGAPPEVIAQNHQGILALGPRWTLAYYQTQGEMAWGPGYEKSLRSGGIVEAALPRLKPQRVILQERFRQQDILANYLEISPSAQYMHIVMGGGLYLIDMRSLTEISVYQCAPGEEVFAATYSQDGKWICICTSNALAVWKMPD
jgi:hypothetical protein